MTTSSAGSGGRSSNVTEQFGARTTYLCAFPVTLQARRALVA